MIGKGEKEQMIEDLMEQLSQTSKDPNLVIECNSFMAIALDDALGQGYLDFMDEHVGALPLAMPRKEKMNIFIDMDGVLTDWVRGVCDLMGLDHASTLEKWPRGVVGMEKVLGMTEDELWEKIQERKHFWLDLKPMLGAKELWDFCNQAGDLYVLSSPSRDPKSASEKIEWLNAFTGEKKFRKYVFTKHKHLLAKPDAILIDDYDSNIDAFVKAGGKGILVPRQWNSNAERACYSSRDTLRALGDMTK
jgi:5'(3')-deoxyribonucleotidase